MRAIRHRIALIPTFCIYILLQPLQAPADSSDAGPVYMANSAAVFCEEKGYTYEIRTAEDGSQSGVCIYDDGSACDG